MNPPLPDLAHGLRIDQITTDTAEMGKLAIDWRIDPIQLQPGSYRGRIRGIQTRRIQLGVCDHSISTRIVGNAPARSVVLAWCLPSSFPASLWGRRLESREMAILRAGEAIASVHPGPTQLFTVAIQRPLADEFAHSRGGASFHSLFPHERLTSASPSGFAATARQLLSLLDQIPPSDPPFANAMAAEDFERDLIAILFARVDFISPRRQRPHRCPYARLAEIHLSQHRRQPLDLSTVCRHLGTTPRTVQLGFRKTFGLSMKSYAQALRFNGARRELISADFSDHSVKAVALNWGFRHLGRFATEYHRWFGECPSTTLAR